jgi:membrane-bound inhibitor of C-type lysozyme
MLPFCSFRRNGVSTERFRGGGDGGSMIAMRLLPHRLAPAAAALLLGGCALCLPEEAALAPAAAPVGAAYACDDGTRLTAAFEPAAGLVTIARAGAAPTVMRQIASGSGIRFTDGHHTFHARGNEAFWITGGTRLVGCRAVA